MRIQDQLLLLIKSLTPAEKKYFVQTAKADGQTKSYLQLYEALLKADAYNADELSQQLKKKKTDLANEKKYLEYLLLKSLRAFNEKQTDVNLLNALASVIILSKKRLYKQALALIEKAKPVAWKSSNFAIYAELCFKQGGIYEVNRGNTTQSGRNRIIQAKNEATRALMLTKEYCELENLQTEATGLMERFNFSNDTEVIRKVDEMLQHPTLLQNYDVIRLKSAKNITLSLLYRLKRDFKKSVLYLEANLAISENFPVESELTEHLYFWELNNLFHTYLALKDYTKAAQQIDYLTAKKYHHLGLKNNELDKSFAPAIIERKLFLSQNKFMDKLGTKEDVLKALKEFERDGERAMQGLLANDQMIMLAMVARLYHATGQPDKALNFTARITNNIDYAFRPTVHASIKCTAIMAHYDLGNTGILKSLVLSAKRFSKKNKLHNPVEAITYQYILQLVKAKTTREKTKIFNDLLKTYHEKKPAQSNNPLHSAWAEANLARLKRP